MMTQYRFVYTCYPLGVVVPWKRDRFGDIELDPADLRNGISHYVVGDYGDLVPVFDITATHLDIHERESYDLEDEVPDRPFQYYNKRRVTIDTKQLLPKTQEQLDEELEPSSDNYQTAYQYRERIGEALDIADHLSKKSDYYSWDKHFRYALYILGLELQDPSKNPVERNTEWYPDGVPIPAPACRSETTDKWPIGTQIVWRVRNEERRKMRRIVCAACRSRYGLVILGVRHFDTHMHANIRARPDRQSFYDAPRGDSQGFVDNFGIYLTRAQAYPIAEAANQLTNIHLYPQFACSRKLHSEVLY